MSLIAPKSPTWSVAGAAAGGVVGFIVGTDVEGGELLWPITLAGVIGGLLIGGLVRTILRK